MNHDLLQSISDYELGGSITLKPLDSERGKNQFERYMLRNSTKVINQSYNKLHNRQTSYTKYLNHPQSKIITNYLEIIQQTPLIYPVQ